MSDDKLQELKELAKGLGFDEVTGSLIKHDNIGLIHLTEFDTPSDLVVKIYRQGFIDCQNTIKRA